MDGTLEDKDTHIDTSSGYSTRSHPAICSGNQNSASLVLTIRRSAGAQTGAGQSATFQSPNPLVGSSCSGVPMTSTTSPRRE